MSETFLSPLERISSISKQLERAGIDTAVLREVLEFHILDVHATLDFDFNQFEDPLSYLEVADYLEILARATQYLCPTNVEKVDLPSSEIPDDDIFATSRTKDKGKSASKKSRAGI